MAYALGIDLGTTFSAAAVSRGGQAEILSLGYHSPTVPSVIVVREGGEVLIGEAAERRALLEPLRTAREFKRRLGDPTPILLGGAPYGAEALMSYLLRGIYDIAVEQQGEPPVALVVSYPANWGLYKLDLLQHAVRMADVGQASFVTEPVAAALHYAGRERIEPGEVVAVYDFGGGTFDAALLRRTETSFEPLGEPEGIERLGGIDFDEAVFAHVMRALADFVADLDPSDSGAMGAVARLRAECRAAKEALSVDTDVTIPVILPNVQTEIRLTRSEFEEMVGPRIGTTIAAFKRAVRSTDLELSDIDKILLVGGSSRIPLVRQRVREQTDSEVFLDAHPKHAIALGAAIAADLGLGMPAAATVARAAPPFPPPARPAPPEVVEQPAPPVDPPVETLETGVPVESPDAPEAAAPPSVEKPPEHVPVVDPLLDLTPLSEPETVEIELPQEPPPDPARPVATERPEPQPQPAVDPAPARDDAIAAAPDDDAQPDIASIASSEWQDGITLSPVLIGALLAVALGSAAGAFLVLSLLME